MKKTLFIAALAAVSGNLAAQNAAPVVSGVTAMANWDTKILTVQYDVTDAENDPLTISAEISNDGGNTYTATSQVTFSGAVGTGISSGTAQVITADLSNLNLPVGAAFRVRVIAVDGQPFDLQALVNEVDSNRLKNDLAFVEGIRHRTAGLNHLNAVKDSILQLYAQHGLYQNVQNWTVTANYMGKNLIGTHRGIGESNKVVIVDAHYDTVTNAPGADDNGSGVVGFMEIARLLSRYPANKTIRYIGFDMEEAGLVGSQRYVNNGGIPTGETIEGVLNFEMIGYYSEEPSSQSLPAGFEILFPAAYNEVANNDFKGDFITNVGNTNSNSLLTLFKSSATTYVPSLRVINVEVPGNGTIAPDLLRSDHAPFWATNRKALMITDGANFRNEAYHTPQDTAEGYLNFTFMANVVKATLATAFQLAEVQHGGWDDAPINSPVSVNDVKGCHPQIVVRDHRINIAQANCTWQNMQVLLVNSEGRTVAERQYSDVPNQSLEFDLPKVPAGVYFVQISGNQGVYSQKIIIKK